jgi:hypothetical protein
MSGMQQLASILVLIQAIILCLFHHALTRKK